jgi:hypothetical protein
VRERTTLRRRGRSGMLFSCSVGYRASTSEPLFRQFQEDLLGNSSSLDREQVWWSALEDGSGGSCATKVGTTVDHLVFGQLLLRGLMP